MAEEEAFSYFSSTGFTLRQQEEDDQPALLKFRCSVYESRAQLWKAQNRRHVVEGIIVGLDKLDGVIQVVKSASNNSRAAADLMREYKLSEKQAEAILDMSLRKLTCLERSKLIEEGKLLREQISKLEELLSSKQQIHEGELYMALYGGASFSQPMLQPGDGGLSASNPMAAAHGPQLGAQQQQQQASSVVHNNDIDIGGEGSPALQPGHGAQSSASTGTTTTEENIKEEEPPMNGNPQLEVTENNYPGIISGIQRVAPKIRNNVN